jgi:hypothetical protein
MVSYGRYKTLCCFVAAFALLVGAAVSRVLRTQEDALAAAFPGARVERRTVFLTENQQKAAGTLAGEKIRSELVYICDAFEGEQRIGTAYFDVHRVRTLPETLMVVVDASNKISRVEVLVFREPMDYLPNSRWYDQFKGLGLDDGLELKQNINGITGATLTARAAVQASRRALSLHAVLAP